MKHKGDTTLSFRLRVSKGQILLDLGFRANVIYTEMHFQPISCQYPSRKHTSSTRTRRGGSCLKDIYKTFLIYRTCMRRAPAKPVRACTLRNWCLVSHVTFEAPLHTSHLTVFTLHTTHFTLHSSHCTLRSQHFTLHSPHFTLHTPHFTLHTPHFTLHSSCPTLHTAPFISSELFSPYPSSSLLISSLLICQQSFHESLPSTTTKELACAVRQPGPCVRALCETGVLFHMSHLKLHFTLRT